MEQGLESLAVGELLRLYRSGETRPVELLDRVCERIERYESPGPSGIWITRLVRERIRAWAAGVQERDPHSLPLYGIPFAIKDNIDLAGTSTTAACPAFAYTPERSAHVVERLMAAGAIPIGKTNLDQFATGLAGTRSPYGVCRNSFNREYISGGSSSGSAVAVALGMASFALGTDTAGSGRVPAALNNLVGLKPTCGRLSSRGMVPACRSLDTISILTVSAEDAARVCRVAEGFDALDPYARPRSRPERALELTGSFRFGVPRPEQLEFFGNDLYRDQYQAAVAQLQRLGGHAVLIDFAPFCECARLLYEGPWVAERYAVIEPLLRRAPEAVHPVTRAIIEAGAHPSAVDAFRAQYRLRSLERETAQAWEAMDVLLTPTCGTIHRIDAMLADPIRLNGQLGYYTNFVNLLDLAAVAVPMGLTPLGLPFGVTLVGPAWSDFKLLQLAARLQRSARSTAGALAHPLPLEPEFAWESPIERILLAVCGAHMEGLPLNHELRELGAHLARRTHTAACYRLLALPGGPPQRPGLVRVADHGASIEVEVWSLPSSSVGAFLERIPAPLAIGRVVLEDGSEVAGFTCEGYAAAEANDISAYGGWRAYLRQGAAASSSTVIE